MRYFEREDRRTHNWKVGDEVICIQNAGFSRQLTINKTYKILKIYYKWNAHHIDIIGDDCIINGLFSSRFTTLKLERKEKLKNIAKIY